MIWWMFFFFLAGMLLILAEFIVPGAICGIVGALMVAGSCIIGVASFPDKAWMIITGEVVGALICLLIGAYIISKTGAAKALVLADNPDLGEDWVSDKSNTALLECEAEVFSALRPAGMIVVDGERVNAVSSGDFINKGATVRVIEVHGNRVVVEPVE
jgi:membrane-bound serine protease (ClpP class)